MPPTLHPEPKAAASAAMSASNSVAPVDDTERFKTIKNRTPVFAVHTATINAIRAGDFKAFDKALHADLNRLDDHYPGGWYGFLCVCLCVCVSMFVCVSLPYSLTPHLHCHQQQQVRREQPPLTRSLLL
jgi:hypothetical protein